LSATATSTPQDAKQIRQNVNTVSVSVAYGDLTIVDLALLPRPQTLQASVTMARDVN